MRDLRHIYTHISEDNTDAAEKTTRSILDRASSLGTFPRLSHLGLRHGMRELALSPLPYVLVYRVRDSYLQIIRIWHGAQSR